MEFPHHALNQYGWCSPTFSFRCLPLAPAAVAFLVPKLVSKRRRNLPCQDTLSGKNQWGEGLRNRSSISRAHLLSSDSVKLTMDRELQSLDLMMLKVEAAELLWLFKYDKNSHFFLFLVNMDQLNRLDFLCSCFLQIHQYQCGMWQFGIPHSYPVMSVFLIETLFWR